MKYMKLFVVGAMVCLAGTVEAQISRVFVSTGGNDANDCLQPATACRTLGGGVGKVDVHGEVIIVDTGSYAGTTITKSVKIDAPPGVVAFSATGIVVTLPTVMDTVVIRGLTLKSLTPGNGTGISLTGSGNLFVENCVLDGWINGVSTTASWSKVFVKNTTFRNNSVGLVSNATSAGVAVEGSFFEKNTTGVLVTKGHVVLSRSVASGNGIGFVSGDGFFPGAGSQLTVQACQVTHNNDGIRTQYGGTARVSDSTIAGNATYGLNNPVSEGGGGTLERFGTNLMSGNAANFGGTITVGTLQ